MEALDVPGWAHFVSRVDADSDSFVLRLVPEAPLAKSSSAFELRVDGCDDTGSANEFLRRAMQQDEYVYAYWREGALVFSSESDEVEVRARSFAGRPSEFTADELRRHLEFFRSLYENADSALRERTLRLREIRDMLIEQHRRVELKVFSREAGSTSEVLYRQQLEFIERVLRAAEA